jgi:pimeloyl-ACP methyl ester carboxylesterase
MSSVAAGDQHGMNRREGAGVEDYVVLGGLRTWYAQHGEGEPVVLLHPGGAGVDARAWAPNIEAISGRFLVFTPERRGHGRTPDAPGPISFEQMAGDTIAFLDTVVGGPAHLVGCSDGAVVALLVALMRPELVRKLVLVAGVFHHDGWAPGVIDPDQTPPEFLARLYAELSPDGPDHYPVVVAKLAEMHAREPTLTQRDLSGVRSRTLVMLGDDDEVTFEHALALYGALPDAELAVIPGASHGLLVEKPALCDTIMLEFLTNEPVQTLAPIRRA